MKADLPRFVTDRGARVLRGGRLILGGQPVRAMRLSPTGSDFLRRILEGRVAAPSPAERELLRRLVQTGILLPIPEPVPGTGKRTTLVIPALNEATRIFELVTALEPSYCEVIVVDDGSDDETGALAAKAGAKVIRNKTNLGPAASRNAGLRAAGTDLVAFLDADCLAPQPDWVDRMAAHLEWPDMVLVSPRIVGAGSFADAGRLQRAVSSYERESSPLDMGADPSFVAAGRRVPYVPSAAMLARREPLLALGGFDERLRFGEDVDLVWRLNEAGSFCYFDPGVQVEHLTRTNVAASLKQRFNYGGSAVDLERLHPGLVSPYRGPLVGLLAAFATAWAGPLPLVANALRLVPSISDSGPLSKREALGATLESGCASTISLGRCLAREWLPVALIAALSRKTRGVTLLAAVCLIVDENRGPAGTRHLRIGLGAVARASYCLGLWSRAASARSPRALLPIFRFGNLAPDSASRRPMNPTHLNRGTHHDQ